ncbi:general negative regulator of transcription subunit 4 [Monosporozyma unispora]|nr:transcriptional repressor general negative regulator of transcription subunit 4 [Kazachstania unispora]
MTSVVQDNLHSYQSNYDPNFLSDEEEEYCPLCIEPLDITDKNFFPCPCGYQICQFCYNNIRQNPELNGRCPACRRKYDDESVEYKVLSPEELKLETAKLARREKERKQREKEKKDNEFNNRKHLAGMRVIQKNLVYVVGVNPPVPFEDVGNTLRSDKYFGQYGKINKIVVNKKTSHGGNDNYHNHHTPGYGVYITFAAKDDAAKCIAQVDGTYMDGKLVKAAYGTTKYCSSYLRGLPCPNPNCMFLHEPGEEADSFNRRELHNKQLQQQQAQQAAQQAAAQQPQTPLSNSTATNQSSLSNALNHASSHNLFKSASSTNGSHTSTNNNSFNHSSTNSPLSIKTHLHGHDSSNTPTPMLTPAHVPVGANPWGVSQSSTPITSLNLSKNISANNLPTLADALQNSLNQETSSHGNHSTVAETLGLHTSSSTQKIPSSTTTHTTTAVSNNSTNTTSTKENNNKKKTNSSGKKYVDPYDAAGSAVRFLDSRIQLLSHYENHSIELRDNLLDDEEYSKYPSLFSWDNIKTSKKSNNILRDKLISVLATKPIDYSASVIQFLQSVSANGVVPITNVPSTVNSQNTTSPSFQGNENLLNEQGNNNTNTMLQQPQQGSNVTNPPPPPGIYPMGQQPQQNQTPQSQTSPMGENGSTNSTDLLNQLIKGRKVSAGN